MSLPVHFVQYGYADYVRVEEDSRHVRHEYVRGEIFAMAGGTPEHARLAGAVIGVLGQTLRSAPCAVYTSDLRVRIDACDVTTYPDVSVIFGPVECSAVDPLAVVNPVLIVEVTSDSTEAYDRGEKLAFYQALPSVREVLIVSHRERRFTLHQRDKGTQEFRAIEWEDTSEPLLFFVGAAITLADIYREPL